MSKLTGFSVMRMRLSTEKVQREKVGPGPNPKKFHHFRVKLTYRHQQKKKERKKRKDECIGGGRGLAAKLKACAVREPRRKAVYKAESHLFQWYFVK